MSRVDYRVYDRRAPRQVVSPEIRRIAERVRTRAAAATPRLTGRLAEGWYVEAGRDPGTSLVRNDVPYARFVEYGTRRQPARAMLGRALAAERGGGIR